MAQLYALAGGTFSKDQSYGIAYYFVRDYRPTNDVDAGSLGKRIWDALQGTAYPDDELVRLQISGVIETGQARVGVVTIGQLDLSDVPKHALAHLLRLIEENVRDILYVEIGTLLAHMVGFGLGVSEGATA